MQRSSRLGASLRPLAGLLAGSWVVLWLAATSAGAESWYAQRFTSGDVPASVEYFWSDDDRFRAHTVVAGRPIVTLVNGERYWILDLLSATGVSIQRSPRAVAQDRERERPFGNEGEELIAAGAEKVRDEAFGGRRCALYRRTMKSGRREICITEGEMRLPLRDRRFLRSGEEVISQYLDWTRGAKLPRAFFEPDPRIQIESVRYDDYVRRSGREAVGPAPVFYRELLHGR